MLYLKANTITEVTVGPAVAVGDGFTPVTGLVGSSADEFEIIKHGATTTTTIAGTLAAITGADGYYALDLSATDTNTEGRLTLLINDDSLILPIRLEFMVVNANVYDSLFAVAGTDYLQSDAFQIAGTTQDATDLADFAAAGYDPGTNKVQGVVLTDTLTTYTGNTLQTADVAARVPNVLNTTALGNIGVDWANVENPATAVDLSATDTQLVDTVTTYTGNTKQTADHTAGIADIPTVSEFNARTQPTADYFDPAVDTVATVTTVTTAVTLPTIPANWITAAGINAGAMDGKGNWNIGKTGYTLTQTFPTNFADMAITLTTGQVTVGTNGDKTGYSISGAITTLDGLNDVAATDIVSAGAITTLTGAVVNVDTVDTTTTNSDMRGTESAALASVATEARLSELDAGTGGKMANQVDIIQTDTTTDIPGTITTLQSDTDDIQTRLPAALVGGRMDANTSAINNNNSSAVQLALSAASIENGAAEGTPSTTIIQTDLAETQDDIYIGRVVIFTSGNARGEATDITDYTGSTGTITVTALANAPSAADSFVLI